MLLAHDVEAGDIWRACQTKDIPVRDWVKLAVTRARAAQAPAIFWLDESRAHDAELIKKVNAYLPEHDTAGLEIRVLAPELATAYSLDRMRQGLDTISVTGNVLRDYNTDLFPILEVGTSAKMLSVVPLIAGGGLFETGAGGSAPKHVQQLVQENYLRWDSLGEFFALVPVLRAVRRVRRRAGRQGAGRHARPGDRHVPRRGPQPGPQARHDRQPRLALLPGAVLGQELAGQTDDAELAAAFKGLAETLAAKEAVIVEELLAVQGEPADIGGYYLPDAGEGRGGDAPLEDLQRGARRVVGRLPRPRDDPQGQPAKRCQPSPARRPSRYRGPAGGSRTWEPQMRPSSLTASRSAASSATEASILPREKSLIATPWMISHSPFDASGRERADQALGHAVAAVGDDPR